MPEIDAARFSPDVIVRKGGDSHYVEVELDEHKPGKWHNMARHQGVIAFCARTPEHRELLMAEARLAAEVHNCTILGTDLRSLFAQANEGMPLWLEVRAP